MLKRPVLTLAIVVLLGAAFLYGVLQLFALGYRRGEVYPAYSSLRSGPLGTKVLYEALDDLPGVSVRRNFRTLPRLEIEEPVTLVYAGIARFRYWYAKELESFEKRVANGSRAIFAFFPIDDPPDETQRERASRIERDRKKIENKDDRKDLAREAGEVAAFTSVARRWNLSFGKLPPERGKTFDRKAVADPATDLKEQISWHSALFFAELGPEWTVLYRCEGQPVVVERKFGAGSLLLASDAFFLSNEAQRSDRQPALLGRVFAGPPTIVFDEEHLGVREQPGIANLARKYRLHGAVAALVLLAALFVWKNAVPFLPRREDPAEEGVVTGKESAEGFVNLLRRTIPPGELLGVCVEEWRKTAACAPADRARFEETWAAEQARPRKERGAVAAYRQLAAALRGGGNPNLQTPKSR